MNEEVCIATRKASFYITVKEGAHTPRGVQLGQSYLQGSAVSFCPVLEETQGLQNLLGRKG